MDGRGYLGLPTTFFETKNGVVILQGYSHKKNTFGGFTTADIKKQIVGIKPIELTDNVIYGDFKYSGKKSPTKC